MNLEQTKRYCGEINSVIYPNGRAIIGKSYCHTHEFFIKILYPMANMKVFDKNHGFQNGNAIRWIYEGASGKPQFYINGTCHEHTEAKEMIPHIIGWLRHIDPDWQMPIKPKACDKCGHVECQCPEFCEICDCLPFHCNCTIEQKRQYAQDKLVALREGMDDGDENPDDEAFVKYSLDSGMCPACEVGIGKLETCDCGARFCHECGTVFEDCTCDTHALLTLTKPNDDETQIIAREA